MHVTCARHEGELREAFRPLAALPRNARQQPRPPELLLEELLEGEEVSVETVTFQGETEVVGVTGKMLAGFPAFVEAGHMVPAQLAQSEAEAAVELARASLGAVGFDHGIAHTEVKLTSRGPRVVEINARLPGNYIPDLLRRVDGFDLAQAAVRLALGERPLVAPSGARVRSAAIRFLLADCDGKIARIEGHELLERDPSLAAWHVSAVPGQAVRRPRDNGDYLGHVLAVDRPGPRARELAEAAASRIAVHVLPDA